MILMFLIVKSVAQNGRNGELIKFKDLMLFGLINVKAIWILILNNKKHIFRKDLIGPTHILIPGLNGNSSL